MGLVQHPVGGRHRTHAVPDASERWIVRSCVEWDCRVPGWSHSTPGGHGLSDRIDWNLDQPRKQGHVSQPMAVEVPVARPCAGRHSAPFGSGAAHLTQHQGLLLGRGGGSDRNQTGQARERPRIRRANGVRRAPQDVGKERVTRLSLRSTIPPIPRVPTRVCGQKDRIPSVANFDFLSHGLGALEAFSVGHRTAERVQFSFFNDLNLLPLCLGLFEASRIRHDALR